MNEDDKQSVEPDEIVTSDGITHKPKQSVLDSLKGIASGGLGILLVLLYFGYGIALMLFGFIGIEEHLGSVWAWVALGFGIILRITFPLTIGAFFALKDVFDLHWLLSLVIVMPGILYLAPAMVLALISSKRASKS